jgi:hypothetical protein
VFRDRLAAPASLFEVPDSLQWYVARDTSAAPFSAVVGLALSNLLESTRHFNLLHPKEPEAERRERVKRVPVAAATAAVFLAALGVLAYNPIRAKNAEIARYTDRIDGLNKDLEEREELLEQWDDFTQWANRNVVWVDQVKRLVEVLPSNEEAYITRMESTAGREQGGEIKIELAAVNKNLATQLVSRIREIRRVAADGPKSGRRLFAAPAPLGVALDKATLPPDLARAFAENKNELSPEATVAVEAPGKRWLVKDTTGWYRVQKAAPKSSDGTPELRVYKVATEQPFEAIPGNTEDNKKDPKYVFEDEVTVTVKPEKSDLPVVPKKKRKRSRS